MVTFRSNNNRRPQFRSNNNRRPPFRSNNEGSKFSNNDNFRRSVPGRNNHNAAKLIEKYNDSAREALAKEDKILSENYFQHADHFTRVQNEQENIKVARINSSNTPIVKPADDVAILIVSFIAATKFVALIEPLSNAISPNSLAAKSLNVVLNVSSVSVTAMFLTAIDYLF